MFKKKQDEWWQRSNEEQNAEMAKTDAAPADAVPAGEAEQKPKKKPQKKSRWDWWDAAGDILEIVLDFVTDLFD